MGFKIVRQRLIEALAQQRYQAEARSVIDEKNLLAIGDISAEAVIGLLKRCRGNQYREDIHHFLAKQKVHVFTPTHENGLEWYIKAYFIAQADGEMAVFISVHQSAKHS